MTAGALLRDVQALRPLNDGDESFAATKAALAACVDRVRPSAGDLFWLVDRNNINANTTAPDVVGLVDLCGLGNYIAGVRSSNPDWIDYSANLLVVSINENDSLRRVFELLYDFVKYPERYMEAEYASQAAAF